MRNNSVKILVLLLVSVLSFSCSEGVKEQNKIDLQGHRGCRGLMPENTIAGFIKALEIGVSTLEMDVVITKDKKVLLSHEPFLSPEICYDSTGQEIGVNMEDSFNLYKMNYEDIAKFDCGSKLLDRFPEQTKMKTHKPLLSDVIDAVEEYREKNSLPLVYYNIEAKSVQGWDEKYHPKPAEFVDLLMEVIVEKNIEKVCNIQSFDPRILMVANRTYPDIALAFLIAENSDFEENLKLLGFIPEIYSPNFFLVNAELMEYAAQNNMKVIPWTVNDKGSMIELLDVGVDGLITDYPDLANDLLKEKGYTRL